MKKNRSCKKIVATKEGGAVTGEERIREHTDSLYSALMSYEGRPAQYQLERIDSLQHELDDATKVRGDVAMSQAQHVRAWLATAFGNLLMSIALSPQSAREQLVAIARYSGDVTWSSAAAWVYLAFLLSILFIGLFRWLPHWISELRQGGRGER